jgi:ABC-type glycerol-3-phosphate transport system substrate-binding protein
MRKARVLFVGTLVLALACGAQAVRHASGPSAPRADAGVDGAASAASAASDVDASPPVDPLNALAAAKDAVAPGMREVERRHVELADGGLLDLPAPAVDTCFRVALAAKEIVDVSFVDASGASLADARGTSPRLGARGPVCVRKGQIAKVTIRGTGAVDAVIWASP